MFAASGLSSSLPPGPNRETDWKFRVVLLGDAGVGKTSLGLRFTTDNFSTNPTTHGIDFLKRAFEYGDGRIVTLEIWDTAGSETYKAPLRSLYREARGIFVVYDVGNHASFLKAPTWLEDVEQDCIHSPATILLGNKGDLADEQRIVSQDQGRQCAAARNVSFMETSAKDGTNVQEAFRRLADMMFEKYDEEVARYNQQGGGYATDSSQSQLHVSGTSSSSAVPVQLLPPAVEVYRPVTPHPPIVLPPQEPPAEGSGGGGCGNGRCT